MRRVGPISGWLCLLPLVGALADEGSDAEPLTADPAVWLDAAEAFDGGGAAVEILYDTMDVTFDGEGRRVQTMHRVYEVRRVEDAGNFGNVTAWWAGWYQERPEVQARVIAPDGRVTVFDPSTLVEETDGGNDPLIYRDSRRLRAPLPALRRGSVVEVVVRSEDHAAFSTAGASVTRLLESSSNTPTHRQRFVARAPREVPLSVRLYGLDEKVRRRRVDGLVEYSVERVHPEPPPKAEEADAWRREIALTQMPWSYAVASTIPDWGAAARAYGELVAGALDPTGLEDVVAAVRDAPDRWEALRRGLRGVQDRVRYTGLEFGLQAIVPFSPAETVARGYGDCKDQASAVVAVLRAAGIEAHLALLSTGTGAETATELPAMRRFDHVIVVAEGPDGPVWMDPTAPDLPLGDLPIVDQDRNALIIDADTRGLVRTPAIGASYREERVIDLRTGGWGRIDETMDARGWTSHAMRRDFLAAGEREVDAWLSDYAERMYWSVSEAPIEVTLAPLDRDSPGVVSEITVPFSDRGRVSQSEASASVAAVLLADGMPDLADPTFREAVAQNEGEDGYRMRTRPYRVEIAWRLLLPPTFGLAEPLEDVEHAFGPLRLWRRVTEADGEVVITYGAENVSAELDFSDAAAFADALALPVFSEELVVSTVPEFLALDAEGEVEQAFAEAQRALQAHGDDAAVVAAWSHLLGRHGFVTDSRRVARELTASQPDVTVGWHALLAASRLDPQGRFDRVPYDRATAFAAAERALALEPWDWYAQDQVLHLGLVGGDDASEDPSAEQLRVVEERIEAWLAEMRELGRDVRVQDLEARRRRVWYEQERWEQLAGLPEDGASRMDWHMALEATARVEGADGLYAFMRDGGTAAQQYIDEQAFVGLMGWPEGLDAFVGMVRRKAEERGMPEQVPRILEFLERVGPWRESVRPSDARYPMMEMLDALFVQEDLAAAVQWFSDPGDDPAGDLHDMGFDASALLGEDLPVARSTLVDLFGAFDHTVEEHPSADHRLVRVDPLGDGDPVALVVTGRGRRARILATGDLFTPLMASARAAIHEGDLEGARVWSRWLLELLSEERSDGVLDVLRALRGDEDAQGLGAMLDYLAMERGDEAALARCSDQLDRVAGSNRALLAGAVARARAVRLGEHDADAIREMVEEGLLDFRAVLSTANEVRERDVDLALQLADHALSVRRDDSDALWLRYSIFAAIGDDEGALEAARTWWEATHSIQAVNSLSWRLLMDEQVDDAITVFEEARALGGTPDADRLHTLAMAYLLAGRIEAAQGLFDEVRMRFGLLAPDWEAVAIGLLDGWGLHDAARERVASVDTSGWDPETAVLLDRLVPLPGVP